MHKAKVIPFPQDSMTPAARFRANIAQWKEAITPALREAAEPQDDLDQRLSSVLATARPKLPEHEAMQALKRLDAKLDQIIYLLRRKGVN